MIAAALTAFVYFRSIWHLDTLGVMVLALLLIWLIPFIRKDGFEKHMKLALLISGAHLIFGIYQTLAMFWTLMKLPSLEGPNGEGAPLAVIIAFFIFSLLTIMPWTLSCIMGFRAVSERK